MTVVLEVVAVGAWLVIGGSAVLLMVFVGSVIAALLAVATEVEQEALLDAE